MCAAAAAGGPRRLVEDAFAELTGFPISHPEPTTRPSLHAMRLPSSIEKRVVHLGHACLNGGTRAASPCHETLSTLA